MARISITDWSEYPTVVSLLKEINLNSAVVLSQYSALFQRVIHPQLGSITDFGRTVSNLISLVRQVVGEIEEIDDDRIDIPQWQMYLTGLDSLFRTWWRLPALYNTGDTLAVVGMVGSDEVIISKEDTWNSLEGLSGASWGDIAIQNKMTGEAEAQLDWTGKQILVPRSTALQSAPVPGVLGDQSGVKVLGKDISNSLELDYAEAASVFASYLQADITASSIGAIVVSDVSGAPPSGYLRIEDEILAFSATDSAAGTYTISQRGVFRTTALSHAAGTVVYVVPFVVGLKVLDYTDTFIQGLQNALETPIIHRIFGSDFGAVKSGLLLVSIMDVLKEDARVGTITNVRSKNVGDGLEISMDVHSVGRLAMHTLLTHYHGDV